MEKFLKNHANWLVPSAVAVLLAAAGWLVSKLDKIEDKISAIESRTARIEGKLEKSMEVVKWVGSR